MNSCKKHPTVEIFSRETDDRSGFLLATQCRAMTWPADNYLRGFAFRCREVQTPARPAYERAGSSSLLLPQMRVVLDGFDAVDLLRQHDGTLSLVLRFNEAAELDHAVICGHVDLRRLDVLVGDQLGIDLS